MINHKTHELHERGTLNTAVAPSASVVGRVTPCAPGFAFPRAAGRGLPALPESQAFRVFSVFRGSTQSGFYV